MRSSRRVRNRSFETLVLLGALALPGALAAQTASPRDAAGRPVTETFIQFDQHFASLILAALDSIPASSYGFRPTPQQQSIGFIAQHLETANLDLCSRIGGTAAKRTAKNSLADSVKALWPKDTLVARYKASLFFCRDVIDRVTDAQLAEEAPWAGERVLRVRWMLFFTTDLAEHYAQLGSYMRLMGMVPPSARPRPSH